MQKWLSLNDYFVHIQNSPTNLGFETKILKNLLFRTRLVGLFTGLPYGNPSLEMEGICSVLFFFSSVSVKVLPVTPLVSGIFVHRAFCAYFLRIERVVELRRFLWWTQ